jgi:hypothetical protein
MHDEHQTGLPFACLVMRISFQVVRDIPAMESKEKTKDTLGKHAVLKSNAQLQIEDQQEVASPPAQDDIAAALSSQTVPPPPTTLMLCSPAFLILCFPFSGRSLLWVFVVSKIISILDATSRNCILRMIE